MIPVSVTLPVFVTVNVYGTTWPARSPTIVVDDLTTWIDGFCAIGMFSVLVAGADSAESTVTVFDEVAARVHLGLRDRVRAAVDPRLGELQLRVRVRVAARQHRRGARTSGRRP